MIIFILSQFHVFVTQCIIIFCKLNKMSFLQFLDFLQSRNSLKMFKMIFIIQKTVSVLVDKNTPQSSLVIMLLVILMVKY